MPLLCPHCQSQIELAGLPSKEEVVCAGCDSRFYLHRDADAPPSPSDGEEKLGKFALREKIGVGPLGAVYKAWDAELERTVAIKVPRAASIRSDEDRNRLLSQARSAAQLRHPGIVPIYEVGEADGVPFLVSDFVKGVTLEEHLAGRRLTFREAARLMADVAESLQVAHTEGVLHGNLKASNIMLADNGKPQLMDFGLHSRDPGEITVTLEGRVLGTPAYLSPEEVSGDLRPVDGRSDVYSLGVIFYRLLTGELPFRGNTRMVLHQILNDPPPSPRSVNDTIPPDLETICLQAMAQEPRRRYATASDLAADLHRFLKGEAIHACPVSRWQQRWRTLRLKPLTAGLAAAGILLLLGTLVATGLGYVTSLQARRQAEEERDAAARNAREAQAGAEREALSRESLQKKEKEARTTLRAALLGQAQALRQSGLPGGREEALEALRQAARVEPGADLRTEFLRCLTSPGSERDSRVVYSFTTGPRLAKPSVNALEFSPGERWLAFAAEEPTVVDLHNPEYPLPVLHAGSGAAAGLAFGGQDDLLAMIGRSNQSAVVWQIPSPLARPMSPARTPTQAAGVNAVGQALAAGMDKDGVIRIWNFDNGYAGPVAVKVATPREMKHLRIGAGAEQVSFLDKKEDQWLLRIHEASGGSEVYSLPLGRTAPEDYALASQPPYAAVSSPQAIVIYDLRSGSPWQTIKAGGQKVTSIALDDTARVLAAAFANGDVKLWNAASGELLALLPSGLKGVDHIALSRSGRWLVAGDAQGHVRLWDIAGTRRLLSEARLDWATPPLGGTAAPAAGTAAAFLEQAQRMHLAGRYQEAADAYGKSLSLAADQSATHRDRGEVFFQLKRYDAAIADFEKARELAPESAYGPSFIKALQFRALALAEASQWEKSAADLLKAIRHGAEKDLPMGERAVLRLAAGDFAAYGKICDSMLIHLMGKEKVETTHPVVWTIVLAPATLHDYARVQEMAEDSADNHVKNWLYQNALGAVLCRAGQYEAALDRLNRSVNLSDKGGHPRDWLFLAITSYQVAQTNESRKWLEKAERWLAETRAQATDAAGFSERWELLILRREAQKLLHASKPVSGK